MLGEMTEKRKSDYCVILPTLFAYNRQIQRQKV